jgi:hypothetical protein
MVTCLSHDVFFSDVFLNKTCRNHVNCRNHFVFFSDVF